MVTIKRSTNETTTEYKKAGGVGLLEKSTPKTYEDYTSKNTCVNDEELAQAKIKMRQNLDRLLNYDKVDAQTKNEEVAVAQPAVKENVVTTSQTDEDIRPTSTTMQFGGDDLEQMRKEMNRSSEATSTGYHLNSKGKMVVALYVLALAVIMTLIIINTGILARLGNVNQEKTAILEAKVAKVDVINEQIETVSDSDYISKLAEELGMIK